MRIKGTIIMFDHMFSTYLLNREGYETYVGT